MNSFKTESTKCLICGSTSKEMTAAGYDYIYEGSMQVSFACRCTSCGHVYLNPRPMMDDIDILYPKNYASFSGKFSSRNSLLSKLKDYVMLKRISCYLDDLPKHAKYLDIGCGDGQLLEIVKLRFPSLEVHGLDWKFNPSVRERLTSLGIILHETTLENVGFSNITFDLVTMYQLIEHLWDPKNCLEKVRNVLSRGGHLVLTTPDIDGYDRKLFASGLWGGYYFPRHLNLFSKKTLMRFLSDCGLETILVRNLVAPVVWCYSLKSLMIKTFYNKKWLSQVFDVHNIPLMALFTILDAIAIFLNVSTSNQLIVVKPSEKL